MKTINLYDKKVYDGCEDVTLDCYIHKPSAELSASPRPAVLVFPGGGYAYVSDREGEPIASAYFAQGYNCFVLKYITGEKAAKNKPLIDAAAAVAHIRNNADAYNIDKERFAVAGFSAGGHLAGYLATSWHLPFLSELLGEKNELFRPNAAILGYPVITGIDSAAHTVSFDNLLGKDRTEEETRSASLEYLVTDKTAPCFIWHTFDDTAVPARNSLLFAEALSAHDIRYEFHIFPKGMHGLARANRETAPDWSKIEYDRPYVARWIDWSIMWLGNQLFGGDFIK